MTVRAPVSPEVIAWALDRSGVEIERFQRDMPKLRPWLHGDSAPRPTFAQVQRIAQQTGIPLGFLFLPEPPELALPIPDFRDGHGGPVGEPSADLVAVINASMRRQDWYREYAEANGLADVDAVGRAIDMTPVQAASDMRNELGYEVDQRLRLGGDNRRALLTAFEALGGLTVATSMVGNNTHRPLDAEEFRGFTLGDRLAPLIFINTHQTMNAQLFTIAHEMAHVWHGDTGVSREDPVAAGRSQVERWCNETASEFLVPKDVLADLYPKVADAELTDQLETLAKVFRCGTLVVLQALRRHRLRDFEDFDGAYAAEMERLIALAAAAPSGGSGGDYWASQRYRIGSRLATAIVRDASAGNTGAADAVHLSGLGSLSKLQELARRLGAA